MASAFTNMHSNMPTTHTTYVCVRIQISDSVVSGWNFFLTCVSETILIAVKCSITWEFRSIRFCCLLFIFRGFCAFASLIFCYLLRQTPCINVKMNRRPIVTGTSVIGITYKGGVMLAADTLGPFAKTNIPACSLLFRCQLCMFCWLSRFVRFAVPLQEADSYQSNWGPDTHRGWGRSQWLATNRGNARWIYVRALALHTGIQESFTPPESWFRLHLHNWHQGWRYLPRRRGQYNGAGNALLLGTSFVQSSNQDEPVLEFFASRRCGQRQTVSKFGLVHPSRSIFKPHRIQSFAVSWEQLTNSAILTLAIIWPLALASI